MGGAWVCVAFGTPQTPPTASGTGLRELSINAPSFLGLASPAPSTERENRREFGGVDVPSVDVKAFTRLYNCSESALKWRWNYLADKNMCVFVTSYRKRPVVSSVYDETVHV